MRKRTSETRGDDSSNKPSFKRKEEGFSSPKRTFSKPSEKPPFGNKDNRFPKKEGFSRPDTRGGDDRFPKRDGYSKPDSRPSDSRFPKKEGFSRPDTRGGDDRFPKRDGYSKPDSRPSDSRFPKKEGFSRPDSRSGDDRFPKRDGFSRPDSRPSDSRFPKKEGFSRPDSRSGDDRFPKRDGFSRPDSRTSDSKFPKKEGFSRPDSRGGDDRFPKRDSFSRPDSRPSDSRFPKKDGFTRPDSRGGDDRFPKKDSFSRPDDISSKPERRSFDRPEFKERFSDKKNTDETIKVDREPLPMNSNYGKEAAPKKFGYKEGSRPNYEEDALKRKLPPKVVAKIESHESRSGSIRLNRYLANAGLCSRREADEFIASGQITVNSEVITEMGYQVKPTDVVKYGRKILNREKIVYVLLNKPKDFLTTTDDPEGRRTVMDLVKKACPERIYPVGRLDRATTGLLLLTNDGELADKLSHPSNAMRKIYQAELDKPITQADFDKILEGLELDDGPIKADDLSVITPDKQVVGIEIHSGKNRIVRRIFESLGYEVTKLDRTTYAGLTKKDLPRGNWRFLTEKEVIRLKYLI
jgi:23S rRNA pseudouridine2605 synthase